MKKDGVVRVWGLLVGDGGDQLEIYNSKLGPFPPDPETEGLVAIGWPAVGDLRMYQEDYSSYIDKFRLVYSHESERAFKTKANMPWKFAFTMSEGDWVICPSSVLGVVLVGQIKGEYSADYHNESGLYGRKRPDFVHIRKVVWKYSIGKSDSRYKKLNRIGQLTLSQQDISPDDLLRIVEE